MKVTVTAGNLGQGLQVVSRAVSSRTTLPILNNVLLQTAETGLQLTATNLEIGIRQVIPAQIQEEGGITVAERRQGHTGRHRRPSTGGQNPDRPGRARRGGDDRDPGAGTQRAEPYSQRRR